MSIENPFVNNDEKSKQEGIKNLAEDLNIPSKIVEKRKELPEDVIVEVPEGYKREEYIRKIVEERRIEKENN